MGLAFPKISPNTPAVVFNCSKAAWELQAAAPKSMGATGGFPLLGNVHRFPGGKVIFIIFISSAVLEQLFHSTTTRGFSV